MQNFHIEDHLTPLYSSLPRMERKPVIGITSNYADGNAMLGEHYYKQVVRAGGVPMLIPPVGQLEVLEDSLNAVDALLLTGGADINPLWQGEQPEPKLGRVNAERDLPELVITRMAADRQMPILGICRGIQTLAMALRGRVFQDISDRPIKHSQDAPRHEATHLVDIVEDSILEKLHGKALAVNSFHHQADAQVPEGFRITATAPDGTIEAMEQQWGAPIVGVQWHPECMGDEGLPIFQWLVDEARIFAQATELHRDIISLDSHCDTPMFFPQGIHFNQRDPRVLVDLHKMRDGLLDATTMAAYLPQADQDAGKAYADGIFDQVQQIVTETSSHVALARTADDLWRNKRQGKKSILLGIENGKALEGQLGNVEHFARRGVTYITLCHNGDNDLCDSARGEQTWGGLSPFGREVIAEMNRQGLLVDLSHAAESSFYEALELSRTPIVCSHSCCRALCNHPRNLTDDQMRALARRGGVMQITLYKGFLRTDGEATIDDAMRHLEHAIGVMGIDHVGIGTDFDGDGGVPGVAHAGEIVNLTREMLRRGYSHQDIEKIWGTNWLRLLHQAQSAGE